MTNNPLVGVHNQELATLSITQTGWEQRNIKATHSSSFALCCPATRAVSSSTRLLSLPSRCLQTSQCNVLFVDVAAYCNRPIFNKHSEINFQGSEPASIQLYQNRHRVQEVPSSCFLVKISRSRTLELIYSDARMPLETHGLLTRTGLCSFTRRHLTVRLRYH